jgi:uncharacterized membrane protein
MTKESFLPQAGPHTEKKVRGAELVISAILRTGVVASMGVIAVGAVVTLIRHPAYSTSARELTRLKGAMTACPHSLREIGEGLRQLHGQAFAALGLLLLILTPVTRVGASILIFLALRDRLYVLITSTVFLLLLLSFFLGRG